ncbi:MAG: MORN repeat-containing protein [Candidatus Marinamargulisbacteria bacterium]
MGLGRMLNGLVAVLSVSAPAFSRPVQATPNGMNRRGGNPQHDLSVAIDPYQTLYMGGIIDSTLLNEDENQVAISTTNPDTRLRLEASLYSLAPAAPVSIATSLPVPDDLETEINNDDGGRFVGTVIGGKAVRGKYYNASGDLLYEGEWKDGQQHGYGTYYYTDGNKYEGEWKDGERHGNGTYYFNDGSRYEGEWKDGQQHGYGTYYYTDGNRYEGEFKGGKKHGQGISYYNNGTKQYEGEWKDSEIYGYGTYYYKSGARYEGELKDGERHGSGTYHYKNGDRYEGEWKDGLKHGQGKMFFPSNSASEISYYEGEFKNGNLHGQGISYYNNGTKQYEGEFKDDKQHGNGTYYFNDGSRYEGEWKDGEMYGYGTYYYKNGARYVGEWKDGERHGNGTYHYKNGDRYEGELKDGLKHGQGRMVYSHGSTKVGRFENDQLVEEYPSGTNASYQTSGFLPVTFAITAVALPVVGRVICNRYQAQERMRKISEIKNAVDETLEKYPSIKKLITVTVDEENTRVCLTKNIFEGEIYEWPINGETHHACLDGFQLKSKEIEFDLTAQNFEDTKIQLCNDLNDFCIDQSRQLTKFLKKHSLELISANLKTRWKGMEGLQFKTSDSMFNPDLELVADLLKRFPLNKNEPYRHERYGLGKLMGETGEKLLGNMANFKQKYNKQVRAVSIQFRDLENLALEIETLQGDLNSYLVDGEYSDVISIQETINLKLKAFETNKGKLSILIANDISTNLLQNIVKYLSLTFAVYCDSIRKKTSGNVISFLRQRLDELDNPLEKDRLERAYTLINEAAQLEQCGTASVATMQTVFTSYSSARQSVSSSAEYKATRNEELQRRYDEVFGFEIDVDNEDLAKVLGCRIQDGVFSCNDDEDLKKNGRRFIRSTGHTDKQRQHLSRSENRFKHQLSEDLVIIYAIFQERGYLPITNVNDEMKNNLIDWIYENKSEVRPDKSGHQSYYVANIIPDARYIHMKSDAELNKLWLRLTHLFSEEGESLYAPRQFSAAGKSKGS